MVFNRSSYLNSDLMRSQDFTRLYKVTFQAHPEPEDMGNSQ